MFRVLQFAYSLGSVHGSHSLPFGSPAHVTVTVYGVVCCHELLHYVCVCVYMHIIMFAQ